MLERLRHVSNVTRTRRQSTLLSIQRSPLFLLYHHVTPKGFDPFFQDCSGYHKVYGICPQLSWPFSWCFVFSLSPPRIGAGFAPTLPSFSRFPPDCSPKPYYHEIAARVPYNQRLLRPSWPCRVPAPYRHEGAIASRHGLFTNQTRLF